MTFGKFYENVTFDKIDPYLLGEIINKNDIMVYYKIVEFDILNMIITVIYL